MNTSKSTLLWDSTIQILNPLIAFLPRVLAMSIVLIIGLTLAWALALFLRRMLNLAGFDEFSERVGLTKLLERIRVRNTPTQLVCSIVQWTVTLLVLLQALSALDLQIANELMRRGLDFLPNVLVAVIILILGHLISDFLADWVTIECVNEGFALARLAGLATRLLIMFCAISIALSQLRIGEQIITAAFTVVFGGIVLGLAIAFGLGGKDLAREWLEQAIKPKPKSSGPNDKETLTHL